MLKKECNRRKLRLRKEEIINKTKLIAKAKNDGLPTDYMAYHSQSDTWQRAFGYNDLYDDVFRIRSYMNYGRIDFYVDGVIMRYRHGRAIIGIFRVVLKLDCTCTTRG